jgi:hypothetical protein
VRPSPNGGSAAQRSERDPVGGDREHEAFTEDPNGAAYDVDVHTAGPGVAYAVGFDKAARVMVVLTPEILAQLPACPRCAAPAGEPCKHARYGKLLAHPHPERTLTLRGRIDVVLGAIALADRGDPSVLEALPRLHAAPNGWRLLRRMIRETQKP